MNDARDADGRPETDAALATGNGAMALRLHGKWARLAQGHVPFAAACSCGSVMPSIGASDFEQLIVEHVATKYRARLAGAPTLGQAVQDINAQNAGLSRLLAFLATQREHPGLVRALLNELAGSIDSFDELHGT